MSFLKKLAKIGKTAFAAYTTYQTGGLSALATQAINKAQSKGRRAAPMPMLQNAIMRSTGVSAMPAAYLGASSEALMMLPRIGGPLVRGGMAGMGRAISRGAKSMAGAAIAGAAAEEGARAIKSMFGKSRKKYRRINPGNIKALRRSVRRIHSAEKMFRQVLSVQGKHHAGIKTKAKRGRK